MFYVDDLQVARISVIVTEDNVGVTSLTVTCRIKNLSDDKYWTGSVWQVAATTVSMTEYDSTNYKGLYVYTGLTAAIALLGYHVEYICAATNIFESAETWIVTVGSPQLQAVYDKLPSKSYITGTNNSDGDLEMNDSTGDFNAVQKVNFTSVSVSVSTIDRFVKQIYAILKRSKIIFTGE